MSDIGSLESLQSLHGDLLAVCEHRLENVETLRLSLVEHTDAFKKLLDKPSRDSKSRSTVQSGKLKIRDEEYSLNQDFVDSTLRLADELELDEIEAAKVLLEAESDVEVMGRSLLECGIIRFHQQRKYLLDCMRRCIDLTNDEELEEDVKDMFGELTEACVFGAAVPGGQIVTPGKFVPRCMAAMADIRLWLQRITEKINSTNLMYQSRAAISPEVEESTEFSRTSLIGQHETLAVILCAAIEKHHSETKHFKDFFTLLKKTDRYDYMLVHLFPALGAFINEFGSTEGVGDLHQARELNKFLCKQSDDDSWTLGFLGATVRAWWIAEYTGWYLDDPAGTDAEGIDLDEEDRQRSKQFLGALKEGAFDFMLSVAADCRTPDWQDLSRSGMRQWLQRKSPPLSDPIPFSEFFQRCLMVQLEVFVDAFISNLPDLLRKLRTEEDEQRQLSQTHEQDLDLERFLIIMAYAYEGRPDAADAFWSDPDSNLAGFLHWASRRASTPLVSAFCEMLQAISGNEECATAAHQFLLDEGHPSSGKMRRTQSLTWSQIFKELGYFTNKIRERPTPAQSSTYRAGKPVGEQAETEPESAMMLECYLRLMTKLSSESETARQMLLRDPNYNLVEVLFQLASSVIPPRLRACVFYALKALLARKSQEEGRIMWRCVDGWMTGGYALQPSRSTAPSPSQNPTALMEAIFNEIGEGFEEPNAFIQFLISLVEPVEGYEPLNDTLPFPEDLGAAVRQPGIDLYVDYALGHIFAYKLKDIVDVPQLRMLRLSCLDFAMACLTTFNENLILLGNECSSIAIDTAISTTDLATYVRLHPFARVMEWLFNDKVMNALFSTIHQESAEVANASPDSPIILGILRAIEVVTKVLDLQDTYLDLVRPLVKTQAAQRRKPVANAAYASFDDGLMNHLNLVVDLGRFCGIGYPSLTSACLKLLEKISTSSKLISAWNPGSGRQAHRNKAIVALEKDSQADAIAVSLSSELTMTLDFGLKTESPNYQSKIYILNFLYECLKANPDQPTIAHLLLGFRCGVNTLAIEPGGQFDKQNSLFHNLLRILLEVPSAEQEGWISGWLVTLKRKAMRILQVLWNSRLSSALVLDELRALKFPFHLLVRAVLIEPHIRWDGDALGMRDFLLVPGSQTYIDFLAMRAMMFEYIAMELCIVSQNRMPMVKREILDALAGQVKGDDNEPITVPNVFHLYDFIEADGQWDIPELDLKTYKELGLRACTKVVDSVVQFEIPKVEQVLLLKRNEMRNAGQIIPQNELSAVEEQEAKLIQCLICHNHTKILNATRLSVLQAWTKLVLVLVETNEFKGTDKAALFQQALQAILPSLEAFTSGAQVEAFELAKLAKVLLFKIDFAPDSGASIGSSVVGKGTPLSDKLFQLFQICLNAIGRWAGDADLRSIYYSICYRYITAITDNGQGFISARQKSVKAIQLYGERLLNVICDDAYGSDPSCQIAAMLLLGAFVNLGKNEDDTQVIETLNRLNFIGILVDSLKTLLQEWLEIIRADGDPAQEFDISAKVSLLLHLAQTKPGAKYVLQANLLRVIETSGLFAADPELEIDATDTAGLEKHYGLLVRVARIVAAAVVRQGSHNVLQGRRFLTMSRGLVVHVLKRSVGIGGKNTASAGSVNGPGSKVQLELDDRIEELAEAFMILITATGFLDFEEGQMPSEKPKGAAVLFH